MESHSPFLIAFLVNALAQGVGAERGALVALGLGASFVDFSYSDGMYLDFDVPSLSDRYFWMGSFCCMGRFWTFS